MQITIDSRAEAPPYEQLRRQIIEQISGGTLRPGARLPAVRTLATQLGLAANTVARSYRELEAEGYVITRGRNGTMVADATREQAGASDRIDQLSREYVDAMRALGLDEDAIRAAVQRML